LRDIVVNTISRRQPIADAELVAVLTTKEEEQTVSLKRDISDATATSRDYFCCLSFFDDCHQSR
jgi:hypothetical protein